MVKEFCRETQDARRLTEKTKLGRRMTEIGGLFARGICGGTLATSSA